ncbi:MAG TPA: hypothetical protein VIS72_11870 [Anaerolineales bacterium]
MDPATLAATVTSIVMPYLTKIGENLAQDAGKKLWEAITDKFKDKPAASGAAAELAEKADDEDNKEAFVLQLKKAIKDDPEFAQLLSGLMSQAGGGNITNTDGVVATNGSVAVRDVQISGDQTGNIVIGSNNTVSQETNRSEKKERNKGK